VSETAAARAGVTGGVGEREAVGEADGVFELVDGPEGMKGAVAEVLGVKEPVAETVGVNEPVAETLGVKEAVVVRLAVGVLEVVGVGEVVGENEAVDEMVAGGVFVGIAVTEGVESEGQHSAAVPAKKNMHDGATVLVVTETSVKLAGPHVSTSVVFGTNAPPHKVVDPLVYSSVYVTNPVPFTVNVRLLLLPRLLVVSLVAAPPTATAKKLKPQKARVRRPVHVVDGE